MAIGGFMRRGLIAVSVALALFGCASQQENKDNSSSQGSVERYLDDSALTAKVKAELVKDVGAKAATDVTVTTENGVVQLAGFASSRDEADRAVAAAKQVSGVRDVKDDIRLK
jgi:hyperosmotically inducible protein